MISKKIKMMMIIMINHRDDAYNKYDHDYLIYVVINMIMMLLGISTTR